MTCWQVGGFSRGTPVSSTNNGDRHDITEILLKVALNTIIIILSPVLQLADCFYAQEMIPALKPIFAGKHCLRMGEGIGVGLWWLAPL